MQYGIYDVLVLFGSLGMFLYGMAIMSDALMLVAGDRLRNILSRMTSNRFFAVMTGFLITSVIQSSSATTLMVVSFVNASLLTLVESIGVVMGANIGTTVTAWLITILGFKVSLGSIALPLVGIGFLLGYSKNKRRKQWGQFVVGFALLFIGLQFLKDAVPDIAANPEVLEFLARYTNMGFRSILLFLLIGTLLTIIIQSSSATMALTLIMCHEGWIPFEMAVAMVLGENIGTTITANMAAVVANFNAKRTARAHFIFNTIGVVWMLVLFTPFLNFIDHVVTYQGQASPFLEPTSVPVALSLFHTAFNIINTAILVAFIPLIARVVKKMVKETKEEEKDIDVSKYLTQESLDYPQTAIAALIKESARLFEKSVYRAIAHGVNVHRSEEQSDLEIKKIVESTHVFEIDFDKLYYEKVKTIYNEIVSYATQAQSAFDLSKKDIETLRNILIANRLLVQVVKGMSSLHRNMSRYVASENVHIRGEYNKLRRMLIKALRQLIKIKSLDDPEKSMQKMQSLHAQAMKSDVIIDGSIDRLVRNSLITNNMATSLMNDSEEVNRMIDSLIKFGELLYLQRDLLTQKEEIPTPSEDLLSVKE